MQSTVNKKRIHMFGIDIDPLTMQEVMIQIEDYLAEDAKKCRFVVTPNVDHLVQLQSNTELQDAYKNAALAVVDGRPVKWAAKILGEFVPCTVPGSDLVPALFQYFQDNNKSLTLYLLGAMPGVADRAKLEIERMWPNIKVVGTCSPDFGFEKNEATSDAICQQINQSGAGLLLIGLGAPKQELWIAKHAPKLSVNVALCIGATIDFLAHEKERAPLWMRKLALEWLHRMLSEPKRLAKRYSVDAIVFPKLVFSEWISKRK